MSLGFAPSVQVGVRRFGLRSTAVVWGIVFAGHCPDHPPEVDDPKVQSLAVVPSALVVEPNQAFIARAWGRDQYGALLPDGYLTDVYWSWTESDGLTATGSGLGARVHLMATGIDPLVILQASHPDLSTPGSADISLVSQSPGPPGTIDWISGPTGTPPIPMFALIAARSAFDWRDDDFYAFAGRRPLHEYIQNPDPTKRAQISVFSRDWSVLRADVTWKPSCDFVDLVTPFSIAANVPGCANLASDVVARETVSAMVFLLADNASPRATADIAYAKGIFSELPVGLDLSLSPTNVGSSLDLELTLNPNGTCALSLSSGMLSQLINQGGIAASQFKPEGLVVAYVEALKHVTVLGGGTVETPMSGFSCPRDASYGRIALVSKAFDGVTTLAHEIGHALGPWPAWGHPDDPSNAAITADFDPANLMWGSELDWTAARRRHLTLGQIFRLTWASGAFVNKAGALDCGTDFTVTAPCPRLSLDVLQP
jgi:hypothetical protein